jgi:predicted PhzF superfamily epimerase YddE/YHI9
VNEDPVTGSAHCTLVPYWSQRLGKKKLVAHQVSQRGGELLCEDLGARVALSGRCVLYLEGEIRV